MGDAEPETIGLSIQVDNPISVICDTVGHALPRQSLGAEPPNNFVKRLLQQDSCQKLGGRGLGHRRNVALAVRHVQYMPPIFSAGH